MILNKGSGRIEPCDQKRNFTETEMCDGEADTRKAHVDQMKRSQDISYQQVYG